MMLPGDEWQTEQGQVPTPADVLKYHATGQKIIIEMQHWLQPIEVEIMEVANRGELFKSYMGWLHTSTVRVLGFPPLPEPEPDMNPWHEEAVRSFFMQYGKKKPRKRKKQ